MAAPGGGDWFKGLARESAGARASTSAFGLVLLGCSVLAAARPIAAVHNVIIDSMHFEPAMLTVNVGDEIVWFNHDPFPHTVTAMDNQFDSGEIEAGRAWRYVATSASVIKYGCTLHPAMVAELRVQRALKP